jgi:hypothetical protein
MLPSEYEIEWIAKERVREALRQAEQDRMFRAARGRASSQGWRRSVTRAVESLLTILAALRAEDPRRRPVPTEPSPSCQRCRPEVCEA